MRVFTLIFCLMMVSCLPQKCSTLEKPKIRIGLNLWPGFAPFFFAEKNKIFAKHDLNIEIMEYVSIQDSQIAWERGHTDLFGGTLVEKITSEQRGHKSRILLATNASNGADVILAHPSISSISALKGKVVGLELGNLGEFFLSRALATAGLTLADVWKVEVAPFIRTVCII